MPERVEIRVDGEALRVDCDATVAAALVGEGKDSFRRSVTGEPRGPLCGMGVCFECRATVDGIPHTRLCLEPCRPGMSIETPRRLTVPREVASGSAPSGSEECSRPAQAGLVVDVAVVGAGPAGIAAACRAAEAGASVAVLDEGLVPGGQIYRHHPDASPPEAAKPWLERLGRSGASHLGRASVVDAIATRSGWSLAVSAAHGPFEVHAARIVLATGAREAFVPFPGWTLPNVVGVGAALALLKSGMSVTGRVAVVAGTGPLLLPVAAALAEAGARVALVAEQASLRSLAGFGASLVRAPGKLVDAARYRRAFASTPYRTGTWVSAARGVDRVEGAVATNGRNATRLDCDLLCVSYGLVPNVELARVLGCDVDHGAVVVRPNQESSLDGVFVAGEPCGIAGVDVALAEGQIAGLAASGRFDTANEEERALLRARGRGRALARAMERAFRPREELARLARPDTILCRCEDVRLEQVDRRWSVRQAKLYTRIGMGPCQGRVCGPACTFLFDWDANAPRPPIIPTPLCSLLSEEPHS
jgi:D-hydroxyproline dehydrogenase subunit alpha